MVLTEMEIGDVFTTDSRTVTKGDVDAFCRVTGAGEAIFLDDETARAAGLKGRVVPGSLTLVTTLGLLEDFTEGLLLAGMDKVRFLTPFYPNDSVKLEVELLDRKAGSKGNRLFLTYSWVLKNQSDVAIASGENTECTT